MKNNGIYFSMNSQDIFDARISAINTSTQYNTVVRIESKIINIVFFTVCLRFIILIHSVNVFAQPDTARRRYYFPTIVQDVLCRSFMAHRQPHVNEFVFNISRVDLERVN